MSIMNVAVTPDYVLVGVDDAAMRGDADGQRVHCRQQKAMVFGRVVVAGQGDLDILACFWGSLLGVPWVWDVQTMYKALETGCADAARKVREHRGADFQPVQGLERTEIVIAGWAECYSEPRAYVATIEGESVSVTRIEHAMAAPGEGFGDELPDMRNTGGMKTVAIQQAARLVELFPDAPVGGEFTIYEILPAAITIRRMGVIAPRGTQTPRAAQEMTIAQLAGLSGIAP